MGKFHKEHKVVIITSGRYAGRKGIIFKSYYEKAKDRKYPHCVVIGLAKGPKKPTKASLKKFDDLIKRIESEKEKKDEKKRAHTTMKDKATLLRSLKGFGVFIKTYNMAHLLVTRYSIKDEFSSVESGMKKIEALSNEIKDTKKQLEAAKQDKKNEDSKKKLEELQKTLGETQDKYKNAVRDAKYEIGTEMFNRFQQGFQRSSNAEENEKQEHTEFLFKKLKF